MSTLKTTNLQHPSAASPAIVLDADGDATYAGVHDFSAATVTGAGGLQLITPTSINNTGGTASATGGEISFTDVLAFRLNGVFTSVYQNYQIIGELTSTDNAGIAILARFSVAGTDTTANYHSNQFSQTSTVLAGIDNSFGTDDFQVSWWGSSAYQGYSAFNAIVQRPQLATPTTVTSNGFFKNNTGVRVQYVTAAFHEGTTAFDGINFTPTAGTITGKIRVYGFKNS